MVEGVHSRKESILQQDEHYVLRSHLDAVYNGLRQARTRRPGPLPRTTAALEYAGPHLKAQLRHQLQAPDPQIRPEPVSAQREASEPHFVAPETQGLLRVLVDLWDTGLHWRSGDHGESTHGEGPSCALLGDDKLEVSNAHHKEAPNDDSSRSQLVTPGCEVGLLLLGGNQHKPAQEDGSCEFYTILAGQGQVRHGKRHEWRACRIGEEFFCPPNEPNEIKTEDEPLLALVFRTTSTDRRAFKREPTMRVLKSRL